MKNSDECQIKTNEFTQKYKSIKSTNTEQNEYVSNQCIVENSDDSFWKHQPLNIIVNCIDLQMKTLIISQNWNI